ncbi:TetR family transcriptional regulator [Amycolatopsis taiwanensis]|uniref:acyl-CoA-like ligand-binding transcription factor n=1 Tax=Amycolatopsis taiwanensis TaxID=342230 RepID=UPI0004801AB0|nr:TetR family transcriptional regulator [Amycolatopsis taiwanensis]
MTAHPDQAAPRNGLRERKKAKTRAKIRQHALRLCAEQGYEATTVEQIAEAAEVSLSTVFRYFPTKDQLIVSDGYDPVVVDAFRAQPAELKPLEAVRAAFRAAFRDMSAEEISERRERQALVLAVPELWAASLTNIKRTQRMLAELVAERAGREPDDPAVRTFAATVFGITLSVWLNWAENPDLDAMTALDEGLAYLEQGLPL